MKSLMASWRSTIDRNTPRLNWRRVGREKEVSTAFSQEHEVGVKWKTNRGCRLDGPGERA
jgi:hypothetical protein